jgi:outer membrane murein-binding lipoprotein Lpp
MTGGDLLVALQDPGIRRGVQQALGMPSEPIVESLRELAAAQARTDETVKQLATNLERLAAEVEQLAAAQARTDATVERLAAEVKQLATEMRAVRRELGGLSDRVGFGLEELGGIVLPGVLEHDHGVRILGGFERAFVRTPMGEEEIDLAADGERDGKPVRVVVESKSRAYEADVRSLAVRAKRISEALGDEVVAVLFGFVIHPSASELAASMGIIAVASRPTIRLGGQAG